jgi:hypothetical protein
MKKVKFVLDERKLCYSDEIQLPPRLRAKLAERRKTGGWEPPLAVRPIKVDAVKSEASNELTLAVALSLGVAITTLAGWITNLIVATIVGLLCAIFLGFLVYGLYSKDSNPFTDNELRELSDSTVRIRLNSLTGRWNGRGANYADEVSGYVGWQPENTDTHRRTRESTVAWISRFPLGTKRIDMLMSHALDLTEEIPEKQSWSSTYLDVHRFQFDPTTEAHQIIEHALAIRIATDHLGEPPVGTSDIAMAAKAAFEQSQRPLNSVWDKLVQRVSTLEEYVDDLRALDNELANVASAVRAFDLDDQFGELLTNAVGDEFAANHLRTLSDDARGLSTAMNDIINSLNGDLQTLMALRSTAV